MSNGGDAHYRPIISVMRAGDRIILGARMEFMDGRVTASYIQEIGPGWKRFGKTYEEWAQLPPRSS